MFNEIIGLVVKFIPFLLTLAVVVAGLSLANIGLKRRWKDNADAQFRFQLIMLSLTFAAILTLIVALPINDALRGQLLSLIGILLSAAIALSSTTFIGNIMAGIMLKVVGNARPGDFITVADLTGRITEMDLLHTEIQTEFRDLVTVPNLYMVTQPLQVVRKSGTIITAEVSLGYDISHQQVARILREATERAGLGEGFIQVRELGDFSITYRVAGMLEDVKSLISARSRLREAMLDTLHEAGIEIVSPNFMNTRALDTQALFIPAKQAAQQKVEPKKGEDIAFDKAEEAASVEQIRQSIEDIGQQIKALETESPGNADEMRRQLEQKQAALIEQLRLAEEALSASEKADGHKSS